LEELEKGAHTTTGARAIVWGQSLEDKNNFLLIGGWDSLEVGLQLDTCMILGRTVLISCRHTRKR
jgi:hypothetical protein